jgi:hypothetical protein
MSESKPKQLQELDQPLSEEPTTETATGWLPYSLRALRHRNYRLFFFGQIISLTGTWLQQVALSWLVYDITNSRFLLGLTSFIGSLPILFFHCQLAFLPTDILSEILSY